MWEMYRLFLEKKSLGIFTQAVSNRSTRALHTLADNIIGMLLDCGG